MKLIFLKLFIFISFFSCSENETDPEIREKFQNVVWQKVSTTGLGEDLSNEDQEELILKDRDIYYIFKEMPIIMYFTPDKMKNKTIWVGGGGSRGDYSYKIIKGGKFKYGNNPILGYKLSEDGSLYLYDLNDQHFSVKYKPIKKIQPGSTDYLKYLEW